MDMQTILICIAVFILSALLIYFISALTMREKTFEEAMQEQQKRHELLLKPKTEGKKDKDKKKKKKKLAQGSDSMEDKNLQASESECECVQKLVELEIDPVVMGEEASEPPAKGGKKKNKKTSKQPKPILLNKDEQPLVKETKEADQLYHTPAVPLDEVQMKRERKRSESEIEERLRSKVDSSAGLRERRKDGAKAETDKFDQTLIKEMATVSQASFTGAAPVPSAATQPSPEQPRKSKKGKSTETGAGGKPRKSLRKIR